MDAMKVWPIIFSTPMILALLAGRKTQTRRLAESWTGVKRGDEAYVRESFAYVGGGAPGLLIYGATWRADAKSHGCDNIPKECPRLTPGIHMPRAIARLHLEMTADARRERLQDISEADAIAEGATSQQLCHGFGNLHPGWSMDWKEPHHEHALGTARLAFANFINRLHGGEKWNLKPSNLWAENPEVLVLTFTARERKPN
jgi:hypothetical protein